MQALSYYWKKIQRNLFPNLQEDLGPLSKSLMLLISVLEMSRIEDFILFIPGYVGRPSKDRVAIARAFVAKIVFNLSTTRMLLDRLQIDIALRRICGWERKKDIPSEATFSRAFAEFAKSELMSHVHESIIKKHLSDRIVIHNSRDATAIEAREKPKEKEGGKKAQEKTWSPKEDRNSGRNG